MLTKSSSKTSKRKATSSKRTRNTRSVTRSAFVPPRNWLSSFVGGFPQTQRQTLNWSSWGTLALTVGTYQYNNCLLNSPFDPDPTLGGTSAAGFAKYMAVYTKCYCVATRFKITMISTAEVPTVCGCTIVTNTTSLSGGLGFVGAIQAGLTQYATTFINPDTRVFLNSVDVAKYLNKPFLLDDPQLFCTSSANPSQLVVLQIWASDLNNALAGAMTYIIELDMDCVFTDPVPVT